MSKRKKNYCDEATLRKLIWHYRHDVDKKEVTEKLYKEFKNIAAGVLFGTELNFLYEREYNAKELIESAVSHMFEAISTYNSRKKAFTYFSVITKRFLNNMLYSNFDNNSTVGEYRKYKSLFNEENDYSYDYANEEMFFLSLKERLENKLNKDKSSDIQKMNYYKYQRMLKIDHFIELLLKSKSYDHFLSILDKASNDLKKEIFALIKDLIS